jgi:hypothetical protein
LFEIDAVFPEERCVLNRDPVNAVESIICVDCIVARRVVSFASAWFFDVWVSFIYNDVI